MNDEGGRLEEIMEVILAIAANDFTRRATVGDGEHVLDGIATGVNMLAEEVGRTRHAEEQIRARLLHSEKLVAVGSLAAGVAHEINNPAAFLLANFTALDDHLAALRNELTAFRVGIDESEMRRAHELLDQIAEISSVGHEGVERIAAIVRGLRTFTRSEADVIVPVRLDEVAEQACVLSMREIVQRARLVKSLAPVPAIMGERTKLGRVVSNLLMNAAQAIGDPTHDTIHQEVEISTEADADHVVLRVRDTGHGIPEAIKNRIFEPFFTTRDLGHGTGLGLSISADIARQHGGELRFESRPGRTVFELSLPRDTGLVAVSSAPLAPIRTGRPRVLVIDDEVQLLRAYERLLGRGHDVVTAAGGAAAIELMHHDRRWDVILCDLLMPVVDGAAVWDWIGENARELRERVLFCSGGAFTPRCVALAERERDRLLEKPIGRAQLEAAIAQVIARAAQARGGA